jgi:hypothetical protein
MLGTFYFGRKSKKIRLSINSGIVFKTKKYNSRYIYDNSIWSATTNDYKYLGIPILWGIDFNIQNDKSINVLFGITLNKIISSFYQDISVNGITEKANPELSYTGLNELYTQLSYFKKGKNETIAFSIGPFISYKYLDDIAFSHNYFHLGRFSYGVAIEFSFLH